MKVEVLLRVGNTTILRDFENVVTCTRYERVYVLVFQNGQTEIPFDNVLLLETWK
jgi:hypothetical protein